MVGVGIDVGTACTKGVALQVFEDGSVSLLGAVVLPSGDAASRPEELGARLTRLGGSAFSRPVAVVGLSHPDAWLDRVRLAVPSDTGTVSGIELLHGLLEGKLVPPVTTAIRDDAWDFLALRLFRRQTDLEQLGKKQVEGLFARIPASVTAANPFRFRPLKPGGYEPTALSVVNAWLRFAAPPRGTATLLMDLGASQAVAMLVGETGLLKVAAAPFGDLGGLVERLSHLEPGQAHQRLMNSDLAATDAVNTAVKDAVVKALHRLHANLWGAGATLPRPDRVLLAGGLATVRGMPRVVNAALELPADSIGQPDRLRTAEALPASYPMFLGAIGAALSAAGAAPYPLRPRLQGAPVGTKGVLGFHLPPLPQLPHLPSLPHIPHLPQMPALPALPGLAALAHLPGWAQISQVHPVDFATSLPGRARGLGRWFMDLPRRMGWGWVAVGVAALIALIPMSVLLSRLGGALDEATAELELVEPDIAELANESRMIRQYATLTGAGLLTVLPWGEAVAEIGGRMPVDSFLVRVAANKQGMRLDGRIKGNASAGLKRVSDRLRGAPSLKQLGLTLP